MDMVSDTATPPIKTTKPCLGIKVDFPPGKSPHSSYPFGIHNTLGDPWNYSVTGSTMVLHAKGCRKIARRASGHCLNCDELTENGNLNGILRRIENGVHENMTLAYHSIRGLVVLIRRKTNEVRGLRLRKLNEAQKLAGKAVALDALKEWVMAVGSRKVERVECLVQVNLARKGGIRHLLDLYDCAAKQIYQPRNYTEEDNLHGLLLWRLGGARVAGIAHRALNLPSLSTLCQHTLIPHLLISPSSPTKGELETNTVSNFEEILDLIKHQRVVHQIFMLDEIKVEERPRWDDESNRIVGVCHEHGKKTSLDFNSDKEIELLLESLRQGEVHLAVEVCVDMWPRCV
jgi:hypothetical protein